MQKLYTSKIAWIVVIGIIAVVAYIQIKPDVQPEYTTTTVKRQDLVQTISVTGTVRGATEVDLNFESAGTLAVLTAAVGDTVLAGEVLAQLSAGRITSAVSEAVASLAAEQAQLDKLLAGATKTQVLIVEQKVSSAEASLATVQQKHKDLLVELAADQIVKQDAIITAQRDVITTRDNLLRAIDNELFDATRALNRAYEILTNASAQTTLGVQKPGSKDMALDQNGTAVDLVTQAQVAVDAALAVSSNDAVEHALTTTYTALSEVQEALSDTFTVLVNTPASSSYTQTAIDSDKTNVTTDQTSVTASITSIQNAEISWESDLTAVLTAKNALTTFVAAKDSQINAAKNAIIAAQVSLSIVQAELDDLQAAARPEEIALQQARVAQARAAVSRAQADLDTVTITAPVDGMITDVGYDIGEKTDLTNPVIMLLGDSEYEIEVDIPESDIAKVEVGEIASITLDAFGSDDVFSGVVSFIDPAETLIQDVVYYRVRVVFDDEITGIKPGMTADIDITTNTKENILVVPSRAVKQNGTKYVDVLENNQVLSKEVTTGLRGDGGLIEITSGLQENEQVITFVKEE